MPARRAFHFAAPVLRLAIAVAAGVFAVAMLAGGLRVLPLLLSPGVPAGVAGPLARGVLGVSLETALFVAPPIAWTLAAARLVEQGEATALAALGVRPARIVAAAWPAAVAVGLAAGLAAAAWGKEAAAPGRLARDLVADARRACLAQAVTAPAAVDVPLVGLSWVCLPGEPPRAVGPAPFGSGGAAFAARELDLSDDLRAIRLSDLSLVLPLAGSRDLVPAGPEAAPWSAPTREVRLRIAEARVRGLAPLGRASNLSPPQRAALLGGSAVAIAALGALAALAWAIRSRTSSLVLGISGPACALLVMSVLERAPSRGLLYLGVPVAGLAATALAAFAARLFQRRRAR